MNFKKSILIISLTSALSACYDDGEDGSQGEAGENGLNSLVTQTQIAVGSTACFNGGVRIDSGLDDNANNILDDTEIDATENVCSPSLAANISNLLASKTTFSFEEGVEALATSSFQLGAQAGNTIDLTIGFGSGAYHYPGDAANVFYTISDRGPNIKCSDAEEIINIADFCVVNGEPMNGKIFPVLDFSPSIYKWELVENTAGAKQVKLLETITLKDADGVPITGLPNPLTFTDDTSNTELAFDANGAEVAFDSEGLDPEAMVRLSDGSFWIAEEYGVSILHVAADGTIISRSVPAGMETQLADANYPIAGDLPAVYHKRKLNRGIESIAVSPDETSLYFIMQSPLQNPNYKVSRNVRVMKYMLVDGELGDAVGEYVYQIDMPETFTDGVIGDLNKNQSDVKISEMLAVGDDDLIILERISKTTKLYRINLASGDNILNSTLSSTGVVANESDELKTLEGVFNLSAVDATPVSKSLVFNSMIDAPDLPKKIEGIAWLDAQHIMLINDNDFGIEGSASEINVLNIGDKFTSSQSDVSEKLEMTLVARYQSSSTGEGAAEIVQYHHSSNSVFAINGDLGNRIEVASLAGIPTRALASPTTDFNLTGVTYDLPNSVIIDSEVVEVSDINSIAIHQNLLAVAIAHEDDLMESGVVLVYSLNANGSFDVNDFVAIRVGVLPDNVAFSKDGSKIVVANEAQATDDPANDQKGSVSIIDVNNGIAESVATTLYFDNFNGTSIPGINVNPDALDLAHAIEPEYVTISNDSSTAYVTLQEVNALAIVDLNAKSITTVKGLGFKDHSLQSNQLDASDKDDKVNIRNYNNLLGLYQPDTITSYQVDGKTYLLTANEGDAGDGFQDVDERVEDLALDATAFPDAVNLQTDEQLGRLKVIPYLGKNENEEYETLYSFGARSFSIWDDSGELVYDSGAEFEKTTAGLYGVNFNNDEDENDPDTRSDAKGPEPEALTVGQVGERTYAFIGMERMGGIAMYDITNPYGVQFISYTNNRDFNDINNGDLAPEGMTFVKAEDSTSGYPLVIVGNEISGTVAVYQVN